MDSGHEARERTARLERELVARRQDLTRAEAARQDAEEAVAAAGERLRAADAALAETSERIDRLEAALRDLGPELRELSLDQIRTEPRPVLSAEKVSRYAKAMQTGATFPPLAVAYDGTAYWLCEGFHRYAALRAIGRAHAPCTIRRAPASAPPAPTNVRTFP